MANRLRVGVLMGGMSGEHEVSLVSAASVIKALDKKKYLAVPIKISKNGKWPESFPMADLARQKVDVIFPVLHGTYGEDGKLQGLLEMVSIPYVGAGVLGSAMAMDKIAAKQIFESTGLLTAKYHHFIQKDWLANKLEVIRQIENKLSYPMFVKPANLGSSVGISKVKNRTGLTEAVLLAGRYDRRILVEEAVGKAKEIECAILGNNRPKASILGRVIPADEFYSYNDKYVDGKAQFEIPAKLPEKVLKKIQALAITAYQALDLSGLARVDFLLDQNNKVYINEINTMPGFTKISMYPKLWEKSGLPYGKLLEKLIDLALERHKEKSQLSTSFKTTDWYKHE